MQKTASLVCSAFINKQENALKGALLSYLTSKQRGEIQDLHPAAHDVTLGFQNRTFLLSWVHFSWFSPFLRNLSESEIRLFLSCLPQPTAQHLKKSLLCSLPLIELSTTAREYLQLLLVEYLLPKELDLLPLEALPSSKVEALLFFSREELYLLTELLGLHDLSVEMRHIIDTVKLKKIHSCLSKEKEIFLNSLSHKREAVVFKRMELQKWDGKAETLLTLLHHRGLNRLAKALYPEDPSQIWYITHRMDMEEAVSLSNLCKPLNHPKAVNLLMGQIAEITTYIQKLKSK